MKSGLPEVTGLHFAACIRSDLGGLGLPRVQVLKPSPQLRSCLLQQYKQSCISQALTLKAQSTLAVITDHKGGSRTCLCPRP